MAPAQPRAHLRGSQTPDLSSRANRHTRESGIKPGLGWTGRAGAQKLNKPQSPTASRVTVWLQSCLGMFLSQQARLPTASFPSCPVCRHVWRPPLCRQKFPLSEEITHLNPQGIIFFSLLCLPCIRVEVSFGERYISGLVGADKALDDTSMITGAGSVLPLQPGW